MKPDQKIILNSFSCFPALNNYVKKIKGYTLIELIVVISLIGIIFSLVAPKFRSAVLTDNLKSATRKLVGRINQVRSDAIYKHTDYFLKFCLEKNEYWYEYADVTAEGSSLAYKNTVEYLPRNVCITDIWIKGTGKQKTEEIAIKFTKNGYAMQSAIYLESKDGRKFTILVNQFLTKIKIMEDYVEFEDT